MSKLHFSIILFLTFTLFCLAEIDYLYQNNYPKIVLPEKAHNTIGEIPLIEHLDDGQITSTRKVIRTVPMADFPCTTGMAIQYSMISSDSIQYYDGGYR